jgi:hypothetical protein
MFGLFGKPDLENSNFNNALIVCLGDSVWRTGDYPTEEELLGSVTRIIKNRKLTQSQVSAIRACALSVNSFSWGKAELKPLILKMQDEVRIGGRDSYDKILELLARRAIILTDDGSDFLSKHGLK